MIDIQIHTVKAKLALKKNKKLALVLQKKKPKNLDRLTQELHQKAFSHIDCLACASCCKSISPIITDKDIQRMAKHLRMRPVQFTEMYLLLDEEHDYVFKNRISGKHFLLEYYKSVV